jgi:YkoY family integral membrane protein
MLALTLANWVTISGTIIWLVVLEGLLSADNALVLAVMVRHLPKQQQRRALRYGIFGAFFFRAVAILLATQILDFWQFEVVGGLYLLYLAINHLIRPEEHDADPMSGDRVQSAMDDSGSETLEIQQAAPEVADADAKPRRGKGFWGTVVGVELADIAFSVDSILAAVAMAEGLPEDIRRVDFGWFDLKDTIVYVGGILGIITMRFVAGKFLNLLERFPGLARGAYYLVGWIGLKLIGSGFHHALFRNGKRVVGGWFGNVPIPDWLGRILEMPSWAFWGGMIAIVVLSVVLGPKRPKADRTP